MFKKFFNWTSRDIAAWEGIRSGGLLRFIAGYGLIGFGGLMFLLLGGATFLIWLWGFVRNRAPATSTAQFVFLGLELAFIAALCLVGGLVSSLVTWFMEEKIYRRYKARIC